MRHSLGLVRRLRDATDTGLRYRFYEIRDASQIDNGVIEMTASTNGPCRFGSYREILNHDAANVNHAACRALLINHDPNQLAGPLRGIAFDGSASSVRAEIDKNAKMQSGVSVRDAVKSGALRGISIGYDYDWDADVDFDEDSRTINVKRWRLMEVSLTPCPRDTDSMVRSFDSLTKKRAATPHLPAPRNDTMDPIKLMALCAAHPRSADFIKLRIDSGEKDLAVLETAVKAHESAGDERERAQAIVAERDALKLRESITVVAESHGLASTKYREMKSITEATAAMIKDKAEAEQKARGRIDLGQPPTPVAELTADAQDKYRDAATDMLLSRSQLSVRSKEDDTTSALVPYERHEKNAGMRNFNWGRLVRECAVRAGESDAMYWNNQQAARWVMQCPSMPAPASQFKAERAANQTYGMFPGILANYFDKAVALGFQSYQKVTYNRWTRPRPAKDFKPFINAAISMGNLTLATEDVAFQEILLADTSYNNQLGLWGGTVTLTYQALVSDDLGEFMRAVGMSGVIAQRTVDKQVYTVLINGPGATSYSSSTGWGTAALASLDTFTGVPLSVANNLDTVREGFLKKLSMAGQFLGNIPDKLLYAPANARNAQQSLGISTPAGEPAWFGSVESRSMEGIEVVYLNDPSITGYSSTNYFVVGDSACDTQIVATLEGMEIPQVVEFDPGATADRKFKVMYPFVTYIPVITDGNGIANRPVGITRGGA